MKQLKKRIFHILLPGILMLLLSSNTFAQTVYNWTGANGTDWTTPGNWQVGGSTATAYPGQSSSTDIADLGVNVGYYHFAGPTTTNEPQINSGTINIGALNFGDNFVPSNVQPGLSGFTGYEVTLIVNGTLNVSGAITQNHSTQGNAGSGLTHNYNPITDPTSPYTYNIYNTMKGTGSVTCGAFNLGDNTTPTNNNVIGVTKFRVGYPISGAIPSSFILTINGDLTCLTQIRGDGTPANTIVSESFAEFSVTGGTVNLYGKLNMVESTSTYTVPWMPQYTPLTFYSMDLGNNNSNPTINFYNANPFNVQTGAVRNNIDFYNVVASGGTGICTVNYEGASQDIATYFNNTSIYNFYIDHNYTLTNVINSATMTSGGSGYVDGTYLNVPLNATNGTAGFSGNGAMANITITGGTVTSATLISGYGSNYQAGNLLSVSDTYVGGSGSGFSMTVAATSGSATPVTYNGVYQNLTFSGSGTKSSGVSGGTMSVLGNFTLAAGTETVDISANNPVLTIGGNLSTASGTTLLKSNASALTIQGTTTNGGTFTHSGTALITFNGAFNNQSTGTYTQSGSGSVVFNNYTMTNSGTYNQSNSGGVTINKNFKNASGGIYNRSGSGAFTAASTTTNGGTFNQSSNTVATFTGAVTNTGTINQTGGGDILFSSTFANSGSASVFSATGGSITTFTGAATNDGTITQNNTTSSMIFSNTFSNTLSGALFTVTQGTSTFSNSYSNVGTFLQTGGTVNFNQSTSQSLTDNSTKGTTFSNVNMKNGGATTMSGTGQFYISDTGLLNMSNNTTLASGGVLTISSDVNGSGTVTAIPSGCQITGNVTVQRYISANRAYRLMSSPVNSGSKDGNGNNYYDVNYLLTNTVLTGTNFPNNGVSSKSGNPTLYLFRENLIPQYTTFLNSNYIGIADISNLTSYVMNDATYTNADIPVGNGYLFYFRGSIKQSNIGALTTAGAAATTDTLNAVGTINYGNITVHPWYQPTSNLGWTTTDPDPTVQGINLVGNPYPSSIDWDQYGSGIVESNVANYSYQLIPTGAQGAGNYNVYAAGTNIGGNKQGTQGSPNSNIIASGEGFLVQAINNSASLMFTEAAKTNKLNTGANLYMGKPPVAKIEQYIHLQLALDSINTDGTIIEFNANAKATFDPKEDAHYRIGTGKLSLSSLSSDNAPIAFNQLPLALRGDTIHLKVGATASGSYKFNVKAVNGIPELYNVYLADALTKDTTDLRKTNSYSFTINTADTTSLGSRRFSLIINQNPLLEYKLLTFTADQVGQSKHVQLTWTTINEQNYTHFTVERSNDNGKTFNVAGGFVSTGAGQYSLVDKDARDGDNIYRLKQEDYNNTITYSQPVHVQITEHGNKDHFTCYPNPAINTINLSFLPKTQNKTTYSLKISNSTGIVVKYAVLTDTNWQGNVSSFLTGTYLIQVVDRSDNSVIGQAKFVKL